MWCANKKKRKHVKRSWHVMISRMLKVSICFTRCNTKQEIVWKFAGALIMPQIHCYAVLYIRLWMWALQVTPGLKAVSWIFLQHQYLQCWQLIAAPVCLKWPWPAELWTLYPCPFNMDSYIVAPLECGVVRHNWLCECAILLFWEGLEYKSFVLKNENRDGVLFLFSYQATRVENGTIPMVSTCSRRVVYGQVKDWFLRSSY